MMTIDAIRAACCLKPHAHWRYDVLATLGERSKNVPYDLAVKETFRQTGRTTEVLLRALSDYSCGGVRVLFVAHNPQMAKRLLERFVDMADRAGIQLKHGTYSACHVNNVDQYTISQDWLIYRDHVVDGIE